MGRAIALRLASAGFLVVGSSRTQRDLDQLRSDIHAAGGEARTIVADAMDRSGARAPVRSAIEAFDRIDVLVNNVGGYLGAGRDPFEMSDDDFERTLVYTLSSAWWTTREALPSMRSRGYGRIINIASTSAIFGVGPLPYVVAKHGMAGMTKALAVSAAPHGITVNCVCPGWTNTPRINWSQQAALAGTTELEAREQAESQNIQHRILEPEEIAAAVSYLASSDAGGITGQIISVDGGFRV
jgi:NAD(P)-dependent dehydrogenase (short-subunit alcohol dehydrogenase family)